MTSDELQQQEDLGRKIAAALAPLDLSADAIACMAFFAFQAFCLFGAENARADAKNLAELGVNDQDAGGNARVAGTLAYFEEQGK